MSGISDGTGDGEGDRSSRKRLATPPPRGMCLKRPCAGGDDEQSTSTIAHTRHATGSLTVLLPPPPGSSSIRGAAVAHRPDDKRELVDPASGLRGLGHGRAQGTTWHQNHGP